MYKYIKKNISKETKPYEASGRKHLGRPSKRWHDNDLFTLSTGNGMRENNEKHTHTQAFII